MSKFFSLAYLTLPNTHPVDQIEIAAQCGYEGVGLRTISQHLPGEPDYALANGRMFQMVRAALERTGVRLMDIELAREKSRSALHTLAIAYFPPARPPGRTPSRSSLRPPRLSGGYRAGGGGSH